MSHYRDTPRGQMDELLRTVRQGPAMRFDMLGLTEAQRDAVATNAKEQVQRWLESWVEPPLLFLQTKLLPPTPAMKAHAARIEVRRNLADAIYQATSKGIADRDSGTKTEADNPFTEPAARAAWLEGFRPATPKEHRTPQVKR